MEHLSWQEEQDLKRKTTMELYRSVAVHLKWLVYTPKDPDDPKGIESWTRTRLVSGPHKINLQIDRGKVNVSGYWPEAPNHGPTTSPREVQETSPEISCSLSRGPEAIAKDIARRFLPEYLRIFAKCQERIDKHVAYESKKAANWALVAASPLVRVWKKGEHSHEELMRGDLRFDGRNLDKGYGDIEMSGDDSVTIKLHSIPVKQAIAILKAIERSINAETKTTGE